MTAVALHARSLVYRLAAQHCIVAVACVLFGVAPRFGGECCICVECGFDGLPIKISPVPKLWWCPGRNGFFGGRDNLGGL